MTYDEFRNNVLAALKERFEDADVTIQESTKNNGIKLYGVIIKKSYVNISPIIYLEGFFEKYQRTGNFNQVLDELIDYYRDCDKGNSIDFHWFTDFDNVKPKIIFRLINTEMNEKLLADVPSIPFNDLSIIFLVRIEDNASITIHNQHMTIWNTSVDELYSLAKVNTPKLMPYVLKDMSELLPVELSIPFDSGLLVLSNRANLYGASTMLYADIFDRFESDLYIIPSSTHECILVPIVTDTPEYFIQMIKEVNDTVVSQTDILSYSLYRYSKKLNKIVIA